MLLLLQQAPRVVLDRAMMDVGLEQKTHGGTHDRKKQEETTKGGRARHQGGCCRACLVCHGSRHAASTPSAGHRIGLMGIVGQRGLETSTLKSIGNAQLQHIPQTPHIAIGLWEEHLQAPALMITLKQSIKLYLSRCQLSTWYGNRVDVLSSFAVRWNKRFAILKPTYFCPLCPTGLMIV